MSSHNHPYGKSENVLGFGEDSKVFIKEEPLKDMFLHPDVKHRKIVAFSIIGAYRKGKSFFLDYCLRYLYAHYPSINYPNNPVSNPTNWMGEEDEPLKGFSWRSGSDRDTTGIVMWNDIFLHTVERTGEKIALVVMDTQGLFDNQSSPMDNSKIFALGTLISSIQVLNLSGVIQEDQLQYLQFATEFAKFAASSSQGSNGKCFQNLMFLIRDWENPDDFACGINGGKNYLENFLEVRSEQKPELKSVREFIHNSFDELSCSLLPHPGKIVTGVKKYKNLMYDGSHSGMDEDFKDELMVLIDHLLNPERLVFKKYNGCNVKGFEYHEYVEHYFKLFQSDELPQAQTIFDATVEKQMTILVNLCFNNYKETVYKNRDALNNQSNIVILHDGCKNKALLMFNEAKKMGNNSHEVKFKKILETEIDKLYEEWGNQTIESINKIADEVEKTRVAIEEKQRLEREQLESEKKAVERLIEIEKLKAEKELEQARFLKEMEIAQLKWESEQKRAATEKQLELERMKHEKEIQHQMFIAEQEMSKLKLESENNRLAAEKIMEMKKYKVEKELEHQKFMREVQVKESNQKLEQERLIAENAQKYALLQLQNKAELEKYKKDEENAKMRLQIEKERLKLLEMENERDAEIRRKLDLQKKVKELEDDKCENPDDYEYGIQGGNEYLREYLTVKDFQKEELRSVRKFIRESFDNLTCALIPHPGKIVTGVRKIKNMLYDGRHKGMDEDFKDELVVVIEHLLNRKNLVTKRVNNHYFDGTEFLDYLENLIEIFQSDKFPKTQTIYEMTVERQMSRLVDSCLQSYKNLIKKDLNTVTNLSMIKILHNKCEAQALLMFNNSNKMGNNEHEIKYKGTLVNDINKEFNQWKIEKEFIFKELNLIRLQQERIHQEEMAKIRAEKTAAKARLDAKRREIESALERSRIVREKELKKERQRDAERQREQEKALECQRRNAERRLEQLRLKSEAERNRFREQEQFNITYFKCNSCDLVVKYSDLHRYSSSAHDFRVCDPTEMFLNQLQDSGLPQMLTRILNRFFNLDLEED